MKTQSKIYMFIIFGLFLLVTGIAQVVEHSLMAVFPLFAGSTMIIMAYRLKKGEE